MRIPAPAATALAMRYAPLSARDDFDPATWPVTALAPNPSYAGWWEIDVEALALSDGRYEYEFLLTTAQSASPRVVSDPYAGEITRFGGYRGVFTVAGGQRVEETFRWDLVVESGAGLASNNRIVIYEMPLRWMSSSAENSLIELGTFDKVIFEHLDALAALGINCIELLPVEDSSQTLNWGYGTRFFFAPDFDIGHPVDAKFFVKACHARGIRVLLDVVMNFFDPQCPLNALAPAWYSQPATPGRQDWGAVLFLFDGPAYGSYFAAREFLCEMGEFWVAQYHVDGFRIDDFADIGNWEFGQTFRDRTTAASAALFPAKPFIVIAEDSGRNFASTAAGAFDGAKAVDAIWNFGYRDEIRRLAVDAVATSFGQPSRSERVRHLISKDGVWNAYGAGAFDAGYADLACSVDYATSHDVVDGPRMLNVVLGSLLTRMGIDGGWQTVRAAVDAPWSAQIASAHAAALRRIFGVFALVLTSVGIPMFLAGEEFGDVHDTDYNDNNLKQQDPVQWGRVDLPGHADLRANVGRLIALRTSFPALERNEVAFFYFHPQFDADAACRVFAYCRTGGRDVGSSGQAVVVANMGAAAFATYVVPGWPWGGASLTEIGYPHEPPVYDAGSAGLTLSLDAFEVRVFTV